MTPIPLASAEAEAQLRAVASLAAKVAEELPGQVAALAALVEATLRGGGKLVFCGNGGSAAEAQHLASEYVVRFARERAPMAALALTTDTSALTACANDYGFERVFERQVRALARPGDLVILHSTSGESENLLRAADAAREMGVATAALLARSGGRLGERVDFALLVPTSSTARAQEVHLAVSHVVCDMVERALQEET